MMRTLAPAAEIFGWTVVSLLLGYVGVHVGILLWFGL